MLHNRLLTLQSRPDGRLKASDLIITSAPVPDLRPGEVLVRNTWLSIDPSIRIRLRSSTPNGYLPPFEPGEPLVGLALGVVEESRNSEFAPGDTVSHMYGYRDYAVIGTDGATIGGYGSLSRFDAGKLPSQWFLGPLGSSGLTAYAGLFGVAGLRPNDTLWVSAAAGAVGSIAAQLAQQRGATVIGSAGSPEKVSYLLDELGLDAAFDYHEGPITDLVAKAAPTGIDVYFDNVGSEHLAAALDNMRPGGRVAVCGALSDYDNATPAPGPSNLFQLVSKGIRVEGFRAGSFNHLATEMRTEIGGYLREGRMKYSELVFDGLEQAPDALTAMLAGDNTGKTLVRLEP
ncbi:NADP-dependent oxidoreductase [Williamsia sp. 1138]|uniref:NADP-dependent oxidoreductase n=1 Tax=Williamsia sp. 1138 TaxID=1903117 RepID=UPI000A0FE999|nr:NADP-dependent oxidoreductase [Williamsia sp. 1138]OZG25815.1 NADP-dependent oxidoreductase [Williamsia sp. 1138]